MFAGELHFQDELYVPEMANRASAEFKAKAAEIENQVGYTFIHPFLMRRTNCAKRVSVLTCSFSVLMVLWTQSMGRENLKSPVAAAAAAKKSLKSWLLKFL